MGDIKIVGMEKLQRKLKQNVRIDDVKKVVRHNGAEMQAKAQQKAPVDTGYLKRSIGLEFTDGGICLQRWSPRRTMEPMWNWAHERWRHSLI